MTIADGMIVAILAMAGWYGWRRGLVFWAPFTFGFCAAVILLRSPASWVQTWVAAQMSAGIPPPSHLYVLRTAAVVQFTIRLGGAALVGAICQQAARARQGLWREALSEPPFGHAARVGGAFDAAVVACVPSCAAFMLLATMRLSALIGGAVLHSALVAPLAGWFGLRPS